MPTLCSGEELEKSPSPEDERELELETEETAAPEPKEQVVEDTEKSKEEEKEDVKDAWDAESEEEEDNEVKGMLMKALTVMSVSYRRFCLFLSLPLCLSVCLWCLLLLEIASFTLLRFYDPVLWDSKIW